MKDLKLGIGVSGEGKIFLTFEELGEDGEMHRHFLVFTPEEACRVGEHMLQAAKQVTQ